MIKAKGTKDGKKIVITYNDDKILFDGKKNIVYELEMKFELLQRHVFGGTYYPESDTEPLNIINVLENYFFDNTAVEIESDENYELPYEDGIIY